MLPGQLKVDLFHKPKAELRTTRVNSGGDHSFSAPGYLRKLSEDHGADDCTEVRHDHDIGTDTVGNLVHFLQEVRVQIFVFRATETS